MVSRLKPFLLIIFSSCFVSPSFAEGISISCGASQGYSYFFEGGVVDKAKAGFTDDGISEGKISLTWNEQGQADVLTIDATGKIKSAISQGAKVLTLPTGNSGINWLAVYEDGTLEVYSVSGQSNKVGIYRNTVGNGFIAKNSLFIGDCE